jgi:hypothetical protein
VDLYLHSPNTSSWRRAELSIGTALCFTCGSTFSTKQCKTISVY